jgi:hypothetical protein
MKKKSLEHASMKYISVTCETSMPVAPKISKNNGKGKEIEQSTEVKEIPKPTIPLTRSSSRKLKMQEEPPEKSQPTENKGDEGQHTFKILRKKTKRRTRYDNPTEGGE